MTDPEVSLDHTSSSFTPLDHSQLNDMRRRVVKGEDVDDNDLKHAIQTLLFATREQAMKASQKTKKAPKVKEKPLDPDINLDDLLDSAL